MAVSFQGGRKAQDPPFVLASDLWQEKAEEKTGKATFTHSRYERVKDLRANDTAFQRFFYNHDSRSSRHSDLRRLAKLTLSFRSQQIFHCMPRAHYWICCFCFFLLFGFLFFFFLFCFFFHVLLCTATSITRLGSEHGQRERAASVLSNVNGELYELNTREPLLTSTREG